MSDIVKRLRNLNCGDEILSEQLILIEDAAYAIEGFQTALELAQARVEISILRKVCHEMIREHDAMERAGLGIGARDSWRKALEGGTDV